MEVEAVTPAFDENHENNQDIGHEQKCYGNQGVSLVLA